MRKLLIVLLLSMFLVSCNFNFDFGFEGPVIENPDDQNKPDDENKPGEVAIRNQLIEMYNTAAIQGYMGNENEWINEFKYLNSEISKIKVSLIDSNLVWNYINDSKVNTLMSVYDLNFDNSEDKVIFRYNGNYIQWKYKDETLWYTLVEIVPEVNKFKVVFWDDLGYRRVEVEEGNTVNQPIDPVKEGFKFIGWYYQDILWDFSSPVISDMELIAKFEKIEEVIPTYVVTFINYYSDQSFETINVEEGNIIPKPQDPVREGYNFIGWYTGDNLWDFNTIVYTDVELVAQWEMIEEIIPSNKITVNYNYEGGYPEKYGYNSDKEKVINNFLLDFYNHLVEQKAFQHKVINNILVEDSSLITPTFEEFSSNEYWRTNFAVYAETILNYYLFTPYCEENGTINENYRDYIEGSEKFFNTKVGQYWLPLADWVNEAVQYNNGAGQDFWARNGLTYASYDLLAKQSYYENDTMYRDHSFVLSITKGTLLGSYRFAQYIAGTIYAQPYKNYIPSPVHQQVIHSIDDQLITPERDGYIFLGWSTKRYDNNYVTSLKEVKDNATLYANWEKDLHYTINYELDGGTCDNLTYEAIEGANIYLPDPTKEGYQFLGWSFEKNSDEYIISFELTKDTTVYANWERLYEIEYVLNINNQTYETRDELVTDFINDFNILMNKSYASPDDISSGSWSDIEYHLFFEKSFDDGTSVRDKWLWLAEYIYEVAVNTLPSSNQTMRGMNALIKRLDMNSNDPYVISYAFRAFLKGIQIRPGTDFASPDFSNYQNANGFYDKMNGNKRITESGFGETILMIPEYNGYTFLGWYDNPNFEGEPIQVTSSAITVYAKWDFNITSVVITFISDSNIIHQWEYPIGDEAEAPLLTKEGFEFKGWRKYNSDEIVKMPIIATEEMTYVAVWEYVPIVGEIVVDPNTDGTETNVYKTIEEALEIASYKQTIVLTAGTYSNPITIDKSVKIIGPNKDVEGASENRFDEAVIDALITIASSDVVIDGIKLGYNGGIRISSDNIIINNVRSISQKFGHDAEINRKGVVYTDEAVSNITISNSYFNTGNSKKLEGVWSSNDLATNITFLNNYFINEATSYQISDCITMYKIAGEINFIGNQFIWVTDNWDIYIGYMENGCTLINIKDNNFDGRIGDDGTKYYSCGISLRRLTDQMTCNVIHNTFGNISGTVISSQFSIEGSKINVSYNAFIECNYKMSQGSGFAEYIYENNYYALEQTTVTSDYGIIKSIEELENIYQGLNDDGIKLQDFADEIVELFNSTGSEDAMVTTQNEFISTTHPNVKFVFSDVNNLSKYKWFIQYIYDESCRLFEEKGYTDDSYLAAGGNTIGEYKKMLQDMIDGNTNAINGMYPDGRTCFRNFIHLLINANNPDANGSRVAYDEFCVDYKNNPEKVEEFLQLYSQNR